MPMNDLKRYMSPDFQAPLPDMPNMQQAPQMDWLPMEQNNDAANMGNIVDQLKKRQQTKSFYGEMGGGAAEMGGMGTGKIGGGGKGSL